MKKLQGGTIAGQIPQKLIIITRRDLSPGYQAVQSSHAGIDFQHQYPDIAQKWNKQSNYLIILSVDNEYQLNQYVNKFEVNNLKTTIFREPDIGNEITAIAVEPNEKSKKICSNLPLAFKEYST